ncbi:hypothetical protein GCM10007854_21600 [Algimonas porphyrae]|uniref:Alpha/beta hydrolase n=2 Tax=Algimonas porphyrae TaxID=1128113 RepID=A0ABQ5V2C4_9PROT|nr:hypothetical protein GCM10007854_21600 [Algimonas porphyrae]
MAAAKHVIFLVHGMGVYRKASDGDPAKRVDDNQWFDSAQKTIKEAYDLYPYLKGRDFDDRYRFVNINYDEYFDALLTNTADAVRDLSFMLPKTVPSDLTKLFAKSKEIEDNFFWTHIVDVLLYKFLKTARRSIKSHVIAKILRETLGPQDKPYSKPRRWTLIAHSMGSIVAHDAVSAIQEEALKSGYAKALQPASMIAMIANVIAPLASDKFAPPYNDHMKPAGPFSATYNYLSAAHRLDPLTQAVPFEGEAWNDLLGNGHAGGGDGPFTYLPTLNHYRPDLILDNGKLGSFDALIPHSFGHYFSNPKVHLPIFSAMDSGLMLSSKEKTELFMAYEEKTATKQRQAITDLLDNLVVKELKEQDDERLLEYWRKAFQILEGAFV